MPGWGTVAGLIADWLPGRKERYRSKINKIKGEMDELLSKKMSARAVARYDNLAAKLRYYEQAIKDAA